MATPRLGQAVPLPAPVDPTKLIQVLAATIVAPLTVWVLPALLLPAPWFPVFGVPEPALEHLIFVRLWGAASVGPLVGFALAWRAPARHPSAFLVGIIANGLTLLAITEKRRNLNTGSRTVPGAPVVEPPRVLG